MSTTEKALRVIRNGEAKSTIWAGRAVEFLAVVGKDGLGCPRRAEAVVPFGEKHLLVEWTTPTKRRIVAEFEPESAVAVAFRRRLHPRGVKP